MGRALATREQKLTSAWLVVFSTNGALPHHFISLIKGRWEL
jgi:hypothetical protein